MENVNHKQKVMELEEEVRKLSGQQNIHQRIHHHAKIKVRHCQYNYFDLVLSTLIFRTFCAKSFIEHLGNICGSKCSPFAPN